MAATKPYCPMLSPSAQRKNEPTVLAAGRATDSISACETTRAVLMEFQFVTKFGEILDSALVYDESSVLLNALFRNRD